MFRWQRAALLFVILGLAGGAALAQPPSPFDDNAPATGDQPKLNVLDKLGPDLSLGGNDGFPKLFLSAKIEVAEGTNVGRLSVVAEPEAGWHTYSITQKPGGPSASKLQVETHKDAALTGPFAADQEPEIRTYEFWKVPAEEHHQKVTWTAPLKFKEGVDPKSVQIKVNYDGQVCKGSCDPIEQTLIAKYAGTYKVAKATGEYRPQNSHVVWQGRLEPAAVAPGGSVKLVLTATPTEDYHIYAYSMRPSEEIGAQPTLIAPKKTNGWKLHPATTNSPTLSGAMGSVHHEGPATWEMQFDVPADAQAGEYEITGLLGFQTCAKNCDLTDGASFRVTAVVGPKASAGAALVAFEPATYKEAEVQATAIAAQFDGVQKKPIALPELFAALGLAFAGGFILNFMPCVLPVIGLKVLQFVEQAGHHRGKVLALNLAYSAGLMAVFMVLATLSVTLNLAWGQQFQELWFQVAITALIFAMGISFLGVWEIPIPGFIGNAKTSEMQRQEGLIGAFSKGVLTTIIATPCSGPLLGSAFGLTLTYPAYATYLIFAAIGLGMALPYLAIGISPTLVKLMPKPGVWMETLKQAMGFVLLGTLVFFLTAVKPEFRIATFALLIGIWFACWLIGRMPVYAEWPQKLRTWSIGVASAAVIGWFAFTLLGPRAILPWEDYTQVALEKAQSEGKTVMIDFTARWCLNCQVNYRFAIDTQATKSVVDKNGVVPMIADWSDRNDGIARKLRELESNSIPVLAIYPAGGGKPIILRDLVTQTQVIAALEKAGPSHGKDAAQQTALAEIIGRE